MENKEEMACFEEKRQWEAGRGGIFFQQTYSVGSRNDGKQTFKVGNKDDGGWGGGEAAGEMVEWITDGKEGDQDALAKCTCGGSVLK